MRWYWWVLIVLALTLIPFIKAKVWGTLLRRARRKMKRDAS